MKPWIYIDVAPNSLGLIDCYIFNAPLIKLVSITAIFKDPRQLELFVCGCEGEDTYFDSNLNFLDIVIKDRLTLLKIKYYRLLQAPILPNDLTYAAG